MEQFMVTYKKANPSLAAHSLSNGNQHEIK